jgi:hypothetical protein
MESTIDDDNEIYSSAFRRSTKDEDGVLANQLFDPRVRLSCYTPVTLRAIFPAFLYFQPRTKYVRYL